MNLSIRRENTRSDLEGASGRYMNHPQPARVPVGLQGGNNTAKAKGSRQGKAGPQAREVLLWAGLAGWLAAERTGLGHKISPDDMDDMDDLNDMDDLDDTRRLLWGTAFPRGFGGCS